MTELIVVSHLRARKEKELPRPSEEEEKGREIPPFLPSPILSLSRLTTRLCLLDFSRPRGGGGLFAQSSERRAGEVMLTLRWLDAQRCLAQYRGREGFSRRASSQGGGGADERDGEGCREEISCDVQILGRRFALWGKKQKNKKKN